MNILFLANHLDTGGITSYLLSLGKGLKDRGHRVFVASSGGNRVTRFTEQGIIFIPIPIRTKSELNLFSIIPSLAILCRQVRENGIDCIHANTRVTQVLARLVSARTGIPFVSTCHGFFRPRFFRRRFPCLGRKVIAISDSVKGHLMDDFKVPEPAIRLVYSGVDTEGLRMEGGRSRGEVRRGFGLGDGPVIGIVRVRDDDELMMITARGKIQRVPVSDISIIGRNTQGVRIMSLDESDTVVAAKRVPQEEGQGAAETP